MKYKLTFKRHKQETGLAGVGHPHRGSDIKINGHVVGMIAAPNWRSTDDWFRIRLTVLGGDNPHCVWRWITLKATAGSDDEARQVVAKYKDALLEKYQLYAVEPGLVVNVKEGGD